MGEGVCAFLSFYLGESRRCRTFVRYMGGQKESARCSCLYSARLRQGRGWNGSVAFLVVRASDAGKPREDGGGREQRVGERGRGDTCW